MNTRIPPSSPPTDPGPAACWDLEKYDHWSVYACYSQAEAVEQYDAALTPVGCRRPQFSRPR